MGHGLPRSPLAAKTRGLVAGATAAALLLLALLVLGAPPDASAVAARGLAPGAATMPERRSAGQAVVLAQDDGLTLFGRASALRGEAVLDDVGEAAADAMAPLPDDNVFFRGAACTGTGTFRSSVTLTFTLPKAIFSGTKLPVYRLDAPRLAPSRSRARSWAGSIRPLRPRSRGPGPTPCSSTATGRP